MAYNLDAIKRKIEDLSGGPKPAKKKIDRPKLKWFKPQLGEYNIRFLPYVDAQGQPFQEVSYYDNKSLNEYRFVAPAQFGQEDPIFDLLNELRKDKSKETWRIMNTLRPKERFYACILVRGEEDEGVQVWEMNSKVLKDIYSVLASPDYAGENMMDPEVGYDFTLKVTDSGKKWNNYSVKEYTVLPRKNPSPLLTNKKARTELVESIPNLEEYFRSMVWGPERLQQMVENFLSAKNSDEAGEEKTTETRRGGGGNAAKNIEDAFADLDDEDEDGDLF